MDYTLDQQFELEEFQPPIPYLATGSGRQAGFHRTTGAPVNLPSCLVGPKEPMHLKSDSSQPYRAILFWVDHMPALPVVRTIHPFPLLLLPPSRLR